MKETQRLPLYHRILIQFYNDFSSGVYKFGDAIPTEASLMKRYESSRTTIRRALADLVRDGIIIRKRGKGSFVNRVVPKTSVQLTGSFDDIMDVAKTTRVKVTRFEHVDATPDILKELQISESSSVLRIDRVRFSEETPFLYSVNYLPDDVGRLLSKRDLEEQPLSELLQKKCQLVLKRAFQTFSATVADHHMADLLKIPLGFPLLEIKRITSCEEDRPINCFLGYFRSDLYVFTAVFSFPDH